MTCQTTLTQEEIEHIFSGFAIEAQKQIPANLQKNKKKVIVIAGPTGCGKSALSMELAKRMGGEIISADSMQVYRGMDIGTSKATKEDRLIIPHHLIDIRHVTELFNVVDFYYEARHCCQLILANNNLPIVAGGAGFYIHSMLFGPPAGPPSVQEVRTALEEEMKIAGSEALYERLKEKDPQYAATITRHDKQKIVRALEIMVLTGKKVSKLPWKTRRKPQNYNFRCWFVYRPKESLYPMIETRCEKMLQMGLLDEVNMLLKEGVLENSSASQAIGYRQAIAFLKSSQGREDYKKFVDDFKQASRHYAKRQFTWYANKDKQADEQDPLFRRLDLDVHDLEVAADIIWRDFESSC